MPTVLWIILLTGAYPVWHAWKANRNTSLLQAVNWTIMAWTVWTWALLPDSIRRTGSLIDYLAISLTSCAIVAVLGARRPGVSAWNFVVVGLLAVLLLPVAESWLAGKHLHLDPLRTIMLGSTLAVGVLNYLPTRLAPAAVLLALGCAGEMFLLAGPDSPAGWSTSIAMVSHLLLAVVPWAASARMRHQASPDSEFDQLWLDFRNRFGLVWGQRLREQFNRAAAHAGWPVVLRWQGLRLTSGYKPDDEVQAEIVAVLRALLKRFGPD